MLDCATARRSDWTRPPGTHHLAVERRLGLVEAGSWHSQFRGQCWELLLAAATAAVRVVVRLSARDRLGTRGVAAYGVGTRIALAVRYGSDQRADIMQLPSAAKGNTGRSDGADVGGFSGGEVIGPAHGSAGRYQDPVAGQQEFGSPTRHVAAALCRSESLYRAGRPRSERERRGASPA